MVSTAFCTVPGRKVMRCSSSVIKRISATWTRSGGVCARPPWSGWNATAFSLPLGMPFRARMCISKRPGRKSLRASRASSARILSTILKKCSTTWHFRRRSGGSSLPRPRSAGRTPHIRSVRLGGILRRRCSVNAPDQFSLPRQVAIRLLGAELDAFERVSGGRNSRIFCVRAAGRVYALKQYPSRQDDPRDRLGTEIGALRLMERHDFVCVPRVIAVDQESNFALLSWIEGAPVTSVGDAEIGQACTFLAAVHGLRLSGEFPPTCYAAEACLSGAEIDRQIGLRLAQLQALEGNEPKLRSFLRELRTAYVDLIAAAKSGLSAAGLDFGRNLPQERQSLVPSDFGFHNTLRRLDGMLAFMDFEYFGWDDPVKLTADVLLHPGTPLGAAQARRFRAAAELRYGSDPSFRTRLDALFALFGVRWVLILLNEFHPERWRRRQLAGAMEDWDEAKSRQLDRARGLLMRLV